MRVIIRCAGEAKPWGDFLGVPPHLAPICGEPILHRTVRLVREFVPEADIRIVVRDRDKRNMVEGTTRAIDKPQPERGTVDMIASSAHLWDKKDRTVLLFGDTWWSRPALRSILTEPVDGWAAWLRKFGGAGELFGFAFDPKAHQQIHDAITTVVGEHQAGRLGNTPGQWALYRALCGKPLTVHDVWGHAHQLGVEDWTEDFDFPRDWHHWCYRWATTPAERRPD
ncbi:NTP transferase domain-containing protein [Mycolicibacterium sp.]|uniref:NTP transferase domain-containing protein n=1 Tax=Mycolicibacterium sp. TaxID=2320850 RepID=UPI00355FFAA0